MKLLHTSDWHLGHTLHGLTREHEHDRFLTWLLGVLERERPDALLLTGDVYETATPPVRAERRFFRFLADARRLLPQLDVVVIGGNHDSAQRLDSPRDLLRELGVHVVGSLGRDPLRSEGLGLDLERLLVPLHDANGAVAAWAVAVPFLRPVDLPPAPDGHDPLVAGVARIYEAALDAARARRQPGQALVATGHCYLVGTALSELSERKVLGGNQHALPVDLFPADVAYAALGHLHRPQAVGGREEVRYAGSPIPLSLAETDYEHQVVLLELEGERLASLRPLLVPRSVELLRLPAEPQPLEQVLARLAELPERGLGPEVERPYLEVRVALEGPQPRLREQVEQALAGKEARLVKLSVTRQDAGPALADAAPQSRLSDLEPAEVFSRCYRRAHGEDPPPAYQAAFAELLDEVQRARESALPEPAEGERTRPRSSRENDREESGRLTSSLTP